MNFGLKRARVKKYYRMNFDSVPLEFYCPRCKSKHLRDRHTVSLRPTAKIL